MWNAASTRGWATSRRQGWSCGTFRRPLGKRWPRRRSFWSISGDLMPSDHWWKTSRNDPEALDRWPSSIQTRSFSTWEETVVSNIHSTTTSHLSSALPSPSSSSSLTAITRLSSQAPQDTLEALRHCLDERQWQESYAQWSQNHHLRGPLDEERMALGHRLFELGRQHFSRLWLQLQAESAPREQGPKGRSVVKQRQEVDEEEPAEQESLQYTRRKDLIKELVQVTGCLHQLLEQLEPQLSGKSPPSLASSSVGGGSLPTPLVTQRSRPLASCKAQCDAVLAAWAAVSRSAHEHLLAAWTPATTPRWIRGVPQRAQYLLEQMQAWARAESATTAGSTIMHPTVDNYNHVVEAWAHSVEHLRGMRAERIFQQMSAPTASRRGDAAAAGVVVFSNGISYQLILRAWLYSRDRRAAFTATGHLMRMLRRLEYGETDMVPTLADYQLVMQAWPRAEDKLSPGKARSILRIMESAFSQGLTAVPPDEICYESVVLTAANRPQLPGLGALVDEILQSMKERYMIPSSACFGAAIRTWKNAALNPDLALVDPELSIQRTWELLRDVKTAHAQSRHRSVVASTEHVNDVLQALSISKHRRTVQRMMNILDRMEEALDQINGEPTPNAESYQLVIRALSSSTLPNRTEQARLVLTRMIKNVDRLQQKDVDLESFVNVFNEFAILCVSSQGETAAENLKSMQLALDAIDEMKRLIDVKPNSQTYTVLLEGCKNLLPPGKVRIGAVDTIFRQCTEAGLVDDGFLRQLRNTATPEQFSNLVVSRSEEIEGVKVVPELWTMNALGGRVVQKDGRRAKPLRIDGYLTVTTAMLEFQMRRLRDKRNRKLLRGGRWTNDKGTAFAQR